LLRPTSIEKSRAHHHPELTPPSRAHQQIIPARLFNSSFVHHLVILLIVLITRGIPRRWVEVLLDALEAEVVAAAAGA
jgi:hypothetical protein